MNTIIKTSLHTMRPASFFYDSDISNIKKYGKSLGLRVFDIATDCDKDANLFEDCLRKVLHAGFLSSLPDMVKSEFKIIREKRINPDTGRLKNYIIKIEEKMINYDVIFDLTTGRKFSNKFFVWVKREALYFEQKTKEIGVNNAYAGNVSQRLRREQIQRNIEYLNQHFIETESGMHCLADFANTAIRRANEIYLESKGFEETAKRKKFTWLFITITVPARFHSNPSVGYSSWDGSSALDAKKWFDERWNNMRKLFNKEKYQHLKFSINSAFGQKVIEPHKDGCPHWHIMLYVSPELKTEYIAIFNEYFRHSDSSLKIMEKGFDENGNPLPSEKVASAASYIFKYVLKYVGLDMLDTVITRNEICDKDLSEATSAIEKVDAWRSALKARSFQEFGINGMKTLYRNLRKIHNQESRGVFLAEYDYLALSQGAMSKDEMDAHECFLRNIPDEFNNSNSEYLINSFEGPEASDIHLRYLLSTYPDIGEVFDEPADIDGIDENIKKALDQLSERNRREYEWLQKNLKNIAIYELSKKAATRRDLDENGKLINKINYAAFLRIARHLDYTNEYNIRIDLRGKVTKSPIGVRVSFKKIMFEKHKIIKQAYK